MKRSKSPRKLHQPARPEKTVKGFVYDAKRAQENARRIYSAISLIEAAKADREGFWRLCDYLRSNPISEELGSEVAHYIEWLNAQLHPPRGTPRGPRGDWSLAMQCVCFLLEEGKRAFRRVSGIKNIHHDQVIDLLIEHAIRLVQNQMPTIQGADGRKFPLKIKIAEVRAFDTKPTRAVIEFVCEFMPQAREEMAALGELLGQQVSGVK